MNWNDSNFLSIEFFFQIGKMFKLMRKIEKAIIRHREKYQDALENLTAHYSDYIEKMMSAFSKCQEMEKVKLEFLKTFLVSLHATLNVTNDLKYVITFVTLLYFG